MSRHPEAVQLRRRPGKRTWYARTTLPGGRRWEASTGVPLTGDRGESTRRAAALYLAAVEEQGRRGTAVPSPVADQLDLIDVVAQYLTHEEETYRGHDDRHFGRIETDLKRYVLPRWTRIEQITSASWLEARDELHVSNGGPLKWRSIAHLANTLRHFLRWARGAGLVQTVPEIESPKSKDQRAERSKRSQWTPGNGTGSSPRWRRWARTAQLEIYRALFYSLMRKGELEALTLRWVDWRNRIVRIPPEHSKSGQPRESTYTRSSPAPSVGS